MGILRTNTISGDETQLSTLGIGTTAPVTGSVLFDGNGDFLTAGTSNDYIFGTGDYTLECWAYFTTLNSENSLASIHNADANWTWKVVSNKLRIYTGTTDVDGTSTIGTGSWFHFAVSRQSSTLRLFVNGINETTTTSTNNYTINNTLHIGAQQNNLAGTYINGYISNLRILKGTALYTANFTPPTLILEPIQDTVLLCCNNPDSAAAVSLAGIGTSKTITVNGNAVASTFNPGLVRNFTYGTQFTGVTRLDTQGYIVPPSGTTEQRNRGRGVFGGGLSPSYVNTIDFIQIQSQGITQDFGDLFTGRYTGACSSSTRGLWGGGYAPGNVNTIDFVTIASTGNAQDFGDLSTIRRQTAGCSSSTRGLWGGGRTTVDVSTIDFVTIASLGNAVSFGDLTVTRRGVMSCSSPTRGVWGGGIGPGSSLSTIDFVTIASTGSALTFGDLSQDRRQIADGACSNSIRGLFGGGRRSPSSDFTNTIDFITIASTGNAIDFGDLFGTLRAGIAATSSPIRGVWAGGYTPGVINTIDFVIISTTGNASDFGDLTQSRAAPAGLSDSHGGIS